MTEPLTLYMAVLEDTDHCPGIDHWKQEDIDRNRWPIIPTDMPMVQILCHALTNWHRSCVPAFLLLDTDMADMTVTCALTQALDRLGVTVYSLPTDTGTILCDKPAMLALTGGRYAND